MVRFSFGEEEEEEEAIAIGNKRRNRRIEDENEHKLQRFGENQDQDQNQDRDQEEELNEEVGWELSEEGGDRDGSRGIENKSGAVSVTIDPDALECSICCEPLRPPLYQCQNGHVACSVCCTKLLQDKCPTCSQSINFTRCRALESVIESIKSSCRYTRYGCSKTLPYVEILSHQETCTYAPCYCPMPNCTFCGFHEQVSSHFGFHHGSSAIDFQYDKQFKVFLKQNKPFIVLREQHGRLFLLLNDRYVDKGNALSVTCLCPNSSECDFMYELIVSGVGCSLQLKASTTNIRKWEGVYPSTVFLMMPQILCSSSGEIVLNACIQKKRAVSSVH